MPKLFRIDIQGARRSGSNNRHNANYQILAETALDAVIASIRRWSATDRSNDEISYISLEQNANEVIEVEGRVDLRNLEFMPNDPESGEASSPVVVEVDLVAAEATEVLHSM